MPNKNLYSLIVVSLILIIAAGWLGYYYGFQAGEKAGKVATQKEVTDLKARFQTFFPPLPTEILSLSGPIKEVGKDFVVIEYILPSELPLLPGETPKTELRKALVTKETKITEFQFPTAIPTPVAPGELPPTPQEKTLKLTDLKVGEQVTVTAQENIKDKKDFEATSIQRFPAPGALAPPLSP